MSGRAEELALLRRSSARRVLTALDLLEPAASAVAAQLAYAKVRDLVAVMDEEAVRDAAAVLAVMAVWELPPAAVRPRTATEIRERLAVVQRWAVRRRLEALWDQS